MSLAKHSDGGDLSKSVDFRFLRDSSRAEMEAACKYEYMRESQALRNFLGTQKHATQATVSPWMDLTLVKGLDWMVLLQRAGFPRSWRMLTKTERQNLVSILATSEDQHPNAPESPVRIEPAAVELDEIERTPDDWCTYHWRLEPREPKLIQQHNWSNFGTRASPRQKARGLLASA
jgi:hypothetical protein